MPELVCLGTRGAWAETDFVNGIGMPRIFNASEPFSNGQRHGRRLLFPARSVNGLSGLNSISLHHRLAVFVIAAD